jgi:hypothetical protein
VLFVDYLGEAVQDPSDGGDVRIRRGGLGKFLICTIISSRNDTYRRGHRTELADSSAATTACKRTLI